MATELTDAAVPAPPAPRGIGCPACGSQNITQKKHTTGWGWFFVVSGIAGACFTMGLSLLLCLVALPFAEMRAKCGACGWRWVP